MSCCFPIAKRWICSLALLLSGLAVQADEPATRDPLPARPRLKQAIAAVDLAFRSEFARAATPRQKRELALKLLQQGIACERDATARYALLVETQRMAKAAGDLDIFIEAASELSETFAVDRWRLRCDALAAWPKKSASERDYKLLATRIFAWTRRRGGVRPIRRGGRIVCFAALGGRQVEGQPARPTSRARAKEVRSLGTEFSNQRPALATLEEHPDDPAANLALGKFYCLAKGDWMRGLPLLARCGDPLLQELARQEEHRPVLPDDQVQLGDAYWSLAEASTGVEQRQLRSRAAHWYQQAEAELTGLTQVRVAQRLASIEPASSSAASFAADRPANLSGTWESSNEGMVVQLHDDGTTIRVELLKADKLSRLDAYFIRAGDRFIVKQWAGAFKPHFDSSGETRSCGAVVLAIDDEHLRVMTDKFWIDSGEITRKVRLGARYVWTKLGEAHSAE